MINIKFLNVDLDIESERNITLIIKELEPNILILHLEAENNYFLASLEIDRNIDNVNLTLNYFCYLIKKLPREARKIWDGCSLKVFNIGYESGIYPNYLISKIEPSIIQRIANLGASITITIYGISKESN